MEIEVVTTPIRIKLKDLAIGAFAEFEGGIIMRIENLNGRSSGVQSVMVKPVETTTGNATPIQAGCESWLSENDYVMPVDKVIFSHAALKA